MPLQNRVTPHGEIVAVADRGTLMGNRGGRLHNDARELTGARWRSARWIACELTFRGRQRTVMAPHRYTELFFLDEATALAAGHRPCAECRRADYRRFREAWTAGNRHLAAAGARGVEAMDAVLHRERTGPRPTVADPWTLPDGAMVAFGPGTDALTLLVLGGSGRRWSFGGYQPLGRPRGEAVLLTPPSVVRALEAGYVPRLHPSVTGGSEPPPLSRRPA